MHLRWWKISWHRGTVGIELEGKGLVDQGALWSQMMHHCILVSRHVPSVGPHCGESQICSQAHNTYVILAGRVQTLLAMPGGGRDDAALGVYLLAEHASI